MREVGVGLLQMECVLGDLEANLERAERLIAEAARQGAQVACLPEMSTTGYNPELLGERFPALAIAPDGPEATRLGKAAAAHSLWLIAPAVERRGDGRLYNSALVFSPDGKPAGSYAKTHLWAAERRHFTPGPGFLTIDAPFGRFGVMICYDAGFPEVARTLALDGAELIFMPSAWRIQDKDIWDLNVPQRALENTLFVVAVNRVGREGDLHLFGNSKVADPRGRICCELPLDRETVTVARLDLALVASLRAEIPYLRDRRAELYAGRL
ncbi:MAG: nitrilase-related carbon-nitrogen hydrolase [Bacillota bacterium]|nr:nitrilase-related carbon-nitrogen hydrolase [Bacillota bacterium]